jgi:amidohydrolase
MSVARILSRCVWPSTLLLSVAAFAAAPTPVAATAAAALPGARSLYMELHQSPELSGHEVQTAAKLAGRLRALGYTVTEQVGGTGIVAILQNGPGPVVMLRTELDALPVEEKTGLAFASKVRVRGDAGEDVAVAHACGHDLHMAAFVTTADVMAHTRGTWHGTLMLVGQPAEETISGASAMLKDGLLTRFARPDVVLALHVGNGLPAGQVGIVSGLYNTNADSLRITIYGKGGHGSAPHTAIDPIVIAARTILALQTIPSREVKPGEFVVVTVGTVRAGTKNNIIPDEAVLGLTVRTQKTEVRKLVLAAIARITKAEAAAGGALREPTIDRYEWTDAVYNEPALARRLSATLAAALGPANVIAEGPITASEDFSFYVNQGIPGFYLSLGGADPGRFAAARSGGVQLPSNHSPLFAPDADPALRTGVAAEIAMLRDLLRGTSKQLHESLAAGKSPGQQTG